MLEVLRKSSMLSKLSQNLVTNRPLNPKQLQRQLANTGASTTPAHDGSVPVKTFNTPHPPKDPPDNFVPSVIHKAFTSPPFLPYAIFRPFETPEEKLGPGAHKCGNYKNPEYYAYHRYSFAEVQRNAIELRQQTILDGGARCIYDYESSGEGSPRPGAGGKDHNKDSNSGSSDDDDMRDRRNCINPMHSPKREDASDKGSDKGKKDRNRKNKKK